MSEAYVKIGSESLGGMVDVALEQVLNFRDKHRAENEAMYQKEIDDWNDRSIWRRVFHAFAGVRLRKNYYFERYDEGFQMLKRINQCCDEAELVSISSMSLDAILFFMELNFEEEDENRR